MADEWEVKGVWQGRHQDSAEYTGWWLERHSGILGGMDEFFHVGSRQDCDDLIALLQVVRERLP